MTALKFEKRDHVADGLCWFAGIYKIVHYDKDSHNNGRPTYRAYHIRKGEKMWGYYVDPATPFYTRLADAQAACKRHAKTY